MSFLKVSVCLLLNFNFHPEKCVRHLKFFNDKKFHWEQVSSGKVPDGKSDEISRKICHFSPTKFSPIRYILIFHQNLSINVSHSLKNIDNKLLFLSFLWLHAVNPFSNFRKHSEKVSYLLQHQIFGLQLQWNWTLQWMFFLRVLQILLEYYFPQYLRAVASMLRVCMTSCACLLLKTLL